jgi:hypothetical protein
VGVGNEVTTESPAPGAEQSICVGCGLCCDGTVLSHIAVRDDSDLGMPLAALGVTIIVEADPPVFELPCPAVSDGVCTIYHLHRPGACGWFECDLSSAVLVGEVGADEARSVIAATVALRDRVRSGEADPAELSSAVQQHFRRGG